jgi:hypothetical protein
MDNRTKTGIKSYDRNYNYSALSCFSGKKALLCSDITFFSDESFEGFLR